MPLDEPDIAAKSLTIQPAKVLRILLLAWFVVSLGGIIVNIMPFFTDGDMSKAKTFWFRLLQLDQEANLPTWFSTGLLTVNAFLLALIAAQRGELSRYWALLSGLFFALSLDETASLHEAVGRIISRGLQDGEAVTFFWVLLAGPTVAVLLVYFWRFLKRLPPRTRNLALLSGVIYVGGALIFEAIGWAYQASQGYVWAGYLALTFIEETMEMLGQVIFCYALLDHMARQRIRLSFSL